MGPADNLLGEGLVDISEEAACLEGWRNGERDEYKIHLDVQSYVGWVMSSTKSVGNSI